MALRVGYDDSQGKTRSVLSFPLTGIPAGSTIAAVSLALDNFGVTKLSGQYVDMELYQVTGDFDENSVTWNSRSNGVPWGAPGGDFSGIPLSTLYQVKGSSTNVFVNTVVFTQAAQAALNAGKPLNLMLMAPDAELATNNLYAKFRSDEATTGQLPMLTVVYTVPPPPSLVIRHPTANTVLISWPSSSAGFTLQQNVNGLSSLSWSNVTDTIQDDGTNRTLTINSPGGTRFYRLFKP